MKCEFTHKLDLSEEEYCCREVTNVYRVKDMLGIAGNIKSEANT